MRFIAASGYRLVAVHEQFEILANGQPRALSPGYTVEFRPWDSTDYERELARETFTWKNLKKDEGGNDLDPLDDEHRIWSFDTNSLPNPELRARVEKAMLDNVDFGRDYILVEPQKVEPPYAKFGEHRKLQGRRTLDHVIADIQAAYEAVGFDIDQAVAYERANGNMGEVVQALEKLRRVEEPEEELVTA